MANDLNKNRYQFMPVMNNPASGNFIATYGLINHTDLQRPDDVFVKIGYGQRIDQLAYDYLGDGGYWWVICMVNGFSTPFDSRIVAGAIVRIPSSIQYILNKLEQRASQNG